MGILKKKYQKIPFKFKKGKKRKNENLGPVGRVLLRRITGTLGSHIIYNSLMFFIA